MLYVQGGVQLPQDSLLRQQDHPSRDTKHIWIIGSGLED